MKKEKGWSEYKGVYTAHTFLQSFAQLLLAHPEVHTVRLQPREINFFHPTKRQKWESNTSAMDPGKDTNAFMIDHGGPLEGVLLHIEVIFASTGGLTQSHDPDETPETDKTSVGRWSSSDNTQGLLPYSSTAEQTGDGLEEVWGRDAREDVWVIIAHQSHIHLHWCTELQRIFSVASVLLWPTPAEGDSQSYSWEGLGPCPNQRRRSFASFHICLSPFLPELHWERDLDGIFGSQHHLTLLHHIQLPQPNHAESPSGGENTERSSSQRDAAQVRYVADRAPCDLNNKPAHRSMKEVFYKRHAKYGVVYPCRIAALLNANILVARGGSSLGKTTLLILHAPGAQLCSKETCRTKAEREVFAYMKYFTTEWILPRLSLEVIGGAWDHAEEDVTARKEAYLARLQPATLYIDDVTFAEHAYDHDDICGLKETLGTSYYYHVQQRRQEKHTSTDARSGCSSSPIRSIVLILDLPRWLWQRMCEEEKSALEIEADLNSCTSFAVPDLETSHSLHSSVAAQAASTMEQTLLLLYTRNVDIFTFGETLALGSNSIPESQLGYVGRPKDDLPSLPASLASSRGGRGQYTRAMLIRSIAESLSEIISQSHHAAFVRVAEDLLFSTPAVHDGSSREDAQLRANLDHSGVSSYPVLARDHDNVSAHVRRRYSVTELRQAIESKLQNS